MNRRALLKGLGRAVAGLALLPLVPLLPKASPIVHAAGGIPMRDGLHYDTCSHYYICYEGRLGLAHADRMTIYGSSVIHLPRPVSRLTVGGPVELSEEKVSKITGISL